MIGVTLSLGSLVAAAALDQFGLAAGASSLGASLDQASSQVQLGLVYATVTPSSGCPTYQGHQEGTSLTVALYDYGGASFTPAAVLVNSTSYPGSYPVLNAGSLTTLTVALGGCAHSSGMDLLVQNFAGDGARFGT